MSCTSGKSQFHQLKTGNFQCSLASIKCVSRSVFSSESQKEQQLRIKKGLEKAKKGDMIQIERSSFLHYGIYIGKEKIVDFVADNGGDVDTRNVYETIGESDFVIDNYLDHEKTPLPADEIVQRAVSSIPRDDLKYDLGRYNCEHFATWCRYNFANCHQPSVLAATLGAVLDKTKSSLS